ncbi:MAG: tRNA lysidine(34) synthetase TilS [Phycisphaeraceae bacterium]|nr:tRNA lysidine(34) synthetase TilS [Phycisphaeraceae bacterium]
MKVARDRAAGCKPKAGPVERSLALSWRELTGGTGRDQELARRTLIACSGGGDSAGLVLALAAAVSRAREVFVVGHVVHDLRSREETLADRDSAKELAGALGLPFVEAEVRARGKGNLEAAARRLRYAALARMAKEAACRYIATAHHAEDQLETILMAMVRGAGPRGMAGIAAWRRVGNVSEEGGEGGAGGAGGNRVGAKLIRPALGVGREELRGVCRSAGWVWREDATNADESRLRAVIRARVVPELERIRPGAAKRAARGASLWRGAAKEVQRQAAIVMERAKVGDTELVWERSELRAYPEVVVGELVRLAGLRLLGRRGRDRMTARVVGRVARAIGDRVTQPREFRLGGLMVVVSARRVVIGAVRVGASNKGRGVSDE